MINILNKIINELPRHLASSEGWQSINMNNHEPVIERVFKTIGDNRVCLNKIYKSDKDLLVHNHSWPFAVKLFHGEYEMGVGISKDGTQPEINAIATIVAGMSYDMSNMNLWHYTKPITDFTYSVMVIGDAERWRPQSCIFDSLPKEKENEILAFFKAEFKNDIANIQ
jgi:hypothetical protein